MYEARQQKEKVNRTIGCRGNGIRPRVKSDINTIMQMMAIIRSGFPDYEYQVNSNDFWKGTSTNYTTQSYVNSGFYGGGTVDLKYEVNNIPVNSFTGNAVAINNIPNQMIQIPGRSTWDAGHALPRQIGGIGNRIEHVFPQSPPINQGNNNALFNTGVRNYLLWRNHETNFAHNVLFWGHGRWKVHVN